ncbi:MAG TPA: RICIN domain-containing protein [Pyrinomonadaceae bacterium]
MAIELEKLRSEMEKSNRTIVEASPDQINKYVIEPLSAEIRSAAREFGGMVEFFHKSQSDFSHKLALELKRELTQDLVSAPTDTKIRSLPPQMQVGEFLLSNVKSGGFLQATGRDSASGGPVEVVGYTGDDPQLWSLHQVRRGYFVIRSVDTGQCLGVEGHGTAEGVKVHQWEYHGGDNQKWTLIPQKDGSYKLRCKHSAQYLSYNGNYVSQMVESDTRAQRWWLIPVIS